MIPEVAKDARIAFFIMLPLCAGPVSADSSTGSIIARYHDPGTPERHGGPGGFAVRLLADERALDVFWSTGWRLFFPSELPRGLMRLQNHTPGQWTEVRIVTGPTGDKADLELLDAKKGQDGSFVLLWTQHNYRDDGFRRSMPMNLMAGILDPNGALETFSLLDDQGSANARIVRGPPVILPAASQKTHVIWLDSRESYFTPDVIGFRDNYSKPYHRTLDRRTGIFSPAEPLSRQGAYAIERLAGAVAAGGVESVVVWSSGGSVHYRSHDGSMWSGIMRAIPTSPASPRTGSIGDLDLLLDREGNPTVGAIVDPHKPPGTENGLIVARSQGSRWTARMWPLPYARRLKILQDDRRDQLVVVFQRDRAHYEISGRKMSELERRGIRRFTSDLEVTILREGRLLEPVLVARETQQGQFDAALASDDLHLAWVGHDGMEILLQCASIPLSSSP